MLELAEELAGKASRIPNAHGWISFGKFIQTNRLSKKNIFRTACFHNN